MTRVTKKTYLNTIPTLGIGVFFLFILLEIFFFVDPSIIRTIPPENSYAIIFLLIFLSACFVLSYLFLNMRRGLLLAIGLTILILFSFLHMISALNIVILLLTLLSFELLLTAKQ